MQITEIAGYYSTNNINIFSMKKKFQNIKLNV